jgi:hypothetical protein
LPLPFPLDELKRFPPSLFANALNLLVVEVDGALVEAPPWFHGARQARQTDSAIGLSL